MKRLAKFIKRKKLTKKMKRMQRTPMNLSLIATPYNSNKFLIEYNSSPFQDEEEDFGFFCYKLPNYIAQENKDFISYNNNESTNDSMNKSADLGID